VRIRTPNRGQRVVTLINLPTITARLSLSYYGAVPPLGLAYIAAAARAQGHQVHVIDATGEALDSVLVRHTEVGALAVQGLSIPQIVGRLDRGTEVVGIAHMFLHQLPLLRELCRAIRARLPDALIVLGGENATAFAEEILASESSIDVCVLGEGEDTFIELLATRERDQLIEVPGLALRVDGAPVRSRARVRISDVDAIPPPAWDLFPVDAYLDAGHSGGVDRGRSMPLLTSRGCPYRCSFCSSPTMWTTRYVRRSPARIIEEIASYVERYRITNVDINDLTAMLTKDWIVEFCTELANRQLGVSLQFPSGTRSEAVDSEAAEAMYAAGVRNFCYAPESGASSTLERIHKRVNLDRLTESLRAAIDAGLTTHASIIIGFPHESTAEMWETYKFVLALARAGLDTVAVMTFAPYPGSEEYERLRAQGKIRLDDRFYYNALLRSAGSKQSVHPQWSGSALGVIQLGFLLSFFGVSYARHPGKIFTHIQRLARGRQESVMDQFLQTKLRQFKVASTGSRSA
jgi:anaerobic magnesium-protoporphyrin IX monomethyl ester cyclase